MDHAVRDLEIQPLAEPAVAGSIRLERPRIVTVLATLQVSGCSSPGRALTSYDVSMAREMAREMARTASSTIAPARIAFWLRTGGQDR